MAIQPVYFIAFSINNRTVLKILLGMQHSDDDGRYPITIWLRLAG